MRYGVFPGRNTLVAGDVKDSVAALQQPGRLRVTQLTITIPLLEELATRKKDSKLSTQTQE